MVSIIGSFFSIINFYFFLEALIKYKAKNTVLPSSIVIYRDGVGVGQMAEVKKKEIECIKVSFDYANVL